jgi:hypothetical protein
VASRRAQNTQKQEARVRTREQPLSDRLASSEAVACPIFPDPHKVRNPKKLILALLDAMENLPQGNREGNRERKCVAIVIYALRKLLRGFVGVKKGELRALSNKNLAKALGTTEGNVRVLLRRARLQLAKSLGAWLGGHGKQSPGNGPQEQN